MIINRTIMLAALLMVAALVFSGFDIADDNKLPSVVDVYEYAADDFEDISPMFISSRPYTHVVTHTVPAGQNANIPLQMNVSRIFGGLYYTGTLFWSDTRVSHVGSFTVVNVTYTGTLFHHGVMIRTPQHLLHE